MGGLFDAPDPPDPRTTSSAQTAQNVNTALANTFLGNVNQVTPQGQLNWSQSGSYGFTDPASGLNYQIPTFTSTQSLNPQEQAIYDQTAQSRINLSGLAQDQSAKLRQQFGSLFDPFTNAPRFGDPASLGNAPKALTDFGANVPGPSYGLGGDPGSISSTFGYAPDVQGTFGPSGDITKTYGDFASERDRIEGGLMERLNPSLAIERNQYEQQLADQGIRYGSPAYENAMRNYSQHANDARLGVIAQAGGEQQRMADMAAQRAGFQNAAQQQEYQQAYGRGEFFNKAQQQQFEQAKGRGEFANAAQQQQFQELLNRSQLFNAAQQQQFGQEAQRGTFANAGLAQNFQQMQSAFNAQNAARQQYLNENFALRNQPINEITALLSGSQVSMPNFLQTNQPSIPTTDTAGIISRQFDQQLASNAQTNASINNIIGGLFGLGGAALGGRRF